MNKKTGAETPVATRNSICITYHGKPGVEAQQTVTVQGLTIQKGQTITEADIPRGFPLSLQELAGVLAKVPGMEVE